MRTEEQDNQKALVRWFRTTYADLSEMLICYPAGINLSISQRIRARDMGLTAGVPDLILFVPKVIEGKFYPCLFIEMKSSAGRLSEVQRNYHRKLKSLGYTIVVCFSFEEARQKIINYLQAS